MINFFSLKDRYACSCDESVMYDKFLLPVKAEGMWLWAAGDPEPYIDLVLGYSSVNFGHKHPFLVKAAQEAVSHITQVHSFHTQDKLLLSQYLADKVSKEQQYKVYFDIGGSSVVASAIRLCRNYSKKRYIICFEGAYHGAGHYAASVSDGHLLNKKQYGINNIDDYVIRLPFPSKYNKETTNDSLEKLEVALNNQDVAGVIVEPIQGANGFIFPEETFLPRLREITTSYNVMMIADEIQVGLGRAGRFFAYQKWEILPDIVLLSKSLSGGFYPLSVIIAKAELFDAVSARGTAFQSTFNNNPFGIHMALKVMELIKKENCFNRSQEKGRVLLERLRFLEKSDCIFNLRGEGLALAFDFTMPNSPNQPDEKRTKRFIKRGLDEHIILYSCGTQRNVIKLAPPLLLTDDELDLIVEKLKTVFDKEEL